MPDKRIRGVSSGFCAVLRCFTVGVRQSFHFVRDAFQQFLYLQWCAHIRLTQAVVKCWYGVRLATPIESVALILCCVFASPPCCGKAGFIRFCEYALFWTGLYAARHATERVRRIAVYALRPAGVLLGMAWCGTVAMPVQIGNFGYLLPRR